MTARALLDELQRRGVELEISGSNLVYTAPRGVVSPEVLESLRRHKEELVKLLRSGSVPAMHLCHACRRFTWWRSIHYEIICGRCHPPVSPDLVLEWLPPPDDLVLREVDLDG